MREPDRVRLAVLTGLPGVGRTALASILRALLGSDAHVSGRFEELRRHYETHSRDRPMLVLIDNVTMAAQVSADAHRYRQPVMVTSHSKLGELVAQDGAELIDLHPLDAPGGVRLLSDQCGQEAVASEPGAAGRLVDCAAACRWRCASWRPG